MGERITARRRAGGGRSRSGVGLGPEGRALQRFLPHEFLHLLGKATLADVRTGDHVERDMTVLFADIRGFTALSESLSPAENFRFINAYLQAMEPALFDAHGFVDKYIGDAIMALFPTGADDAVRGAVGMLERLRRFNAGRRSAGAPAVRIGIGLNSGPAMAGAVGGLRRLQPTVISDTVNTASRLESLTKTYGVPLLISEHTLHGLADPGAHDLRFVDRVRVRGREQPQSIYEVFDADAPALRAGKRRTRALFEEALAHYHLRDIPAARRLLRRCLAACPGDRVAEVYLDRCARYQRTGVHESTGETDLTLSWSPAFRVGHPVIDAQHRTLFARVNRFTRMIQRVRTESEVRGLAAFLRSYVEEHFGTEEAVMRRARYPLLPMHRQQHERFAREFARLEAELREGLAAHRVFLLFKVQLLLVDWLAHHTMKLDRHFGRFLAARERRRVRRGER